jgi:hypothetical protein
MDPTTSTTEAMTLINDRIITLRAKHANLDEAIRVESARPMPDFFVISELKKKKLTVKEEIKQLEKKISDAA